MIPLQMPRLKDFPETPAVYCIENKINGMKYIGQTKNVRQRIYGHIYDSRWSIPNPKQGTLYGDYNLQQGNNFVVYILEHIDDTTNIRDKLLRKEREWLLKTNADKLYNGNNARPRDTNNNIPKKAIWIDEKTHTRFKSLAASHTMTATTFLNHLLDKFEEKPNNTTPETVDETWRFVHRSECYYCKEIFMMYRYNDLDKFQAHLDEYNRMTSNHRCPEQPKCHTCDYTDEKCKEICARCLKGHYYCECRTIIHLTCTDPKGNILEVPKTV